MTSSKNPSISSGRPRLVYALEGGPETMKRMLSFGYDVNAIGFPPYAGETVLAIAIGRDLMELVRLLLDAGASPNIERPLLQA